MWRASVARSKRLGYSIFALERFHFQSNELHERVRTCFEHENSKFVIIFGQSRN